MKKKGSVLLGAWMLLTAVFSMPILSSCDDGVEISFATATEEYFEPITRKTGDLYGKLPVPTREGYTFLGWKTEKMGGEYARRSVKVEKDIDHTLYAKWRKDEEEITFPLEPKKESLDGGGGATFYIDEEGQLYAWGKNDQGQLGDGTTENRLSPVAVMTDKKWAQVAGDDFGRKYGIDEEGGLWSWGSRKTRPSSDSDTTPPQLTPERIMPNKKFCRIEAGWGEYRHFALALDVNGGLWVWGDNYYGQLGQGGETSGTTNPWEDSGDDTPRRIKKDVRFVEISTNGETCGAIDEEGKLWLWGDNLNGQLASGKVFDGNDLSTSFSWLASSIPTVAIETEGVYFTQVYCTTYNTFALDNEGNIWGCGSDFFDRLGNREKADSSILIQLTSDIRFKQIRSASPSVALDDYGDLWWWGSDRFELLHKVECLKDHLHEHACEGAFSPVPVEVDCYGLDIVAFYKSSHRIYIFNSKNEVWGWSKLKGILPAELPIYLGDGPTELRGIENRVRIF